MLAWLYKPTIFNQDPSDYPLFEISQRWARDGFSQVSSMVEISPALGNGATVVAYECESGQEDQLTRLARQNSWGLAFVDSAEVVLFGDESEDVETATSVQTYPWGSKLGVGERLRLAQRREIIANPDQDPRIQEGFVVITDTSRSAHGDFYIQARYLAVDDVWIVETRKGNAQQHYGREVQDRDTVITIFRQWLETGDVSADENDWHKVEL